MCVLALFYLAQVLFLLSYAVRDMLWLRVLSIVAGLCAVPYFVCAGDRVQYDPLVWQSVYVLINVFNVTVLILQRRPVSLSPELQRLYEADFRAMTPRDFLSLVSAGEWREAGPDVRLVTAGADCHGLILLASGTAHVLVQGTLIASLRAGQFAGEMSYVTRKVTNADVVTTSPVRYLYWHRESLNRLLSRRPQLREVFHGILCWDMANKLVSPILVERARAAARMAAQSV